MSSLAIPVSEEDHAQGPPRAPVTLLEYGDYQCPFCGQAYPIVKKVQAAMGQKLRFVFRNFPLTQAHPYAELAAEAAEAAAAEEKFWEMHDALYENQAILSEDGVVEIAQNLGLNQVRFVEDIRTRKFKNHVRKDFMGGVKSGVNGTPCFFINGQRHDRPWDYDTLLNSLTSLTSQLG
jgi:protein-disulfide isomerase